jgi:hypothetical protein
MQGAIRYDPTDYPPSAATLARDRNHHAGCERCGRVRGLADEVAGVEHYLGGLFPQEPERHCLLCYLLRLPQLHREAIG